MNAPEGNAATTLLPRGWAIARVSDLVQFVTSGSRGWGEYYSESGARFIRVGDFGRGSISLDLEEMAHVEPPEGSEGERTAVRSGDVLLTITADVGMVAVAPSALGPAYVNQHVALIRPLDGVDGRAFAYCLLDPVGFQSVVREAQYGATKAGLSLLQLREFEVKVPPHDEQPRIVEALDAYLTRLDAATKGLDRVEASLKRYRASVLSAAVEGRLVPTEPELAKREGRSYESGHALLARILKERRSRWEKSALAQMKERGQVPTNDKWLSRYEEPTSPDTTGLADLPEGWCWATLDCLLEEIEAGKSFKCEERPPMGDEVGVVKVSAVTWGVFDEEESKTCQTPDLVDERLFIKENDFLFSRANTIQLVGAAVIAGPVTRKLMLSDKILRFRTIGNIDRWLLAVLRSPGGRHQIEKLSTGNQESMRNIGQGRIRNICVPLPPRAEIDRISEAISDCQGLAERLDRTVRQDSARVVRLRQAILKWAFEGRLVDQDPKDEPAAVLLDRIRRERLATADEARRPARAPGRKIA